MIDIPGRMCYSQSNWTLMPQRPFSGEMNRMKRILLALLWVLPILAGLTSAAAQESGRKLTLMIYMCGSNLESSYGSASDDLQEMIAAAPGVQDATVLIMTGGTTRWSTGYDASRIQISELGRRGMRVVWQDEAASMGAAHTLTQLLQFGVEKYPADEYALILWDHGGGPLEGVCWDELFAMDNLRLGELIQALEAAQMPDKLSWIGFDACLMSSLEVAGMLSPYADYMIASQETEPAHGWNYAFLAGLGNDSSGAETGRRIIDTYFEGREDTRDVLTLSCLDLSRAEAALAAVDSFFGGIDGMGDALFNAVSGVRMNAAGFGKGLRGLNDDGYDLVDLMDLTQRLSPLMNDAAPLQQAIGELVVYSRANIDDANGVSVYHPYMNKKKFQARWQADYAALSIAPAYTAYVGRFGDWLTGEAMADWSGLCPVSLGFDGQGSERFALQLTAAQTTDFASAQMVILKEIWKENRTVAIVGTVPVQMNEGGLLTATAEWYGLYIQDGLGGMGGPLSYMMTSGDSQMVIQADLVSNDDGLEILPVLYYLDVPSQGGAAQTTQMRVMDQATGTYTNRIAVNEADYGSLMLVDTHRRLPDSDGQEELPDVYSWELNFDSFTGVYIDPAMAWNFLWEKDIVTDDVFYAVFAITDTQQNTYCSQPIRLQSPHQQSFTAVPERMEMQDVTAELSGYVSAADHGAGLRLVLQMNHPGEQALRMSIESVTLNGTRCINWERADDSNSCVIGPQGAGEADFIIGPDQLLGLTEITQASFVLKCTPEEGGQSRLLEASFRLENCDVSPIRTELPVLAQGEQDGLAWQVLRIERSEETGHEMLIMTENRTDAAVSFSGRVLINGVGSDTSYLRAEIPPGASVVTQALVYNDLFAASDSFYSLFGRMISRHILQGYGVQSISEITILNEDRYSDEILSVVTMPLSVPVPVEEGYEALDDGFFIIERLPEEEMLSRDKLVTLVEHPDMTIRLERMLVGENNVSLALHLTNHSDVVQRVELDEVVISGAAYGKDVVDEVFAIAPDSTRVVCAVLGAEIYARPKTDSVERLEFVISGSFSQERYPVSAVLKEAAPYDVPDGVYVLPEEMIFADVQPAAPPTQPPVWEGPVAVFMDAVTVPAEAAQYRRSFSVQLTKEQAEQASGALMLMVQEAENGHLRVINYQRPMLKEDNTLSADATGLVLCLEELPQVLIPTAQSDDEAGAVQLTNTMTLSVTSSVGDAFSTSVVSELSVLLAADGSQAAVDSVVMTYDPLPAQQSDIFFVRFPTYELLCSLTDPALPYAASIPMNTGDTWFNSLPTISPEGYPFQLALRPVTAEDRLYVMFSVRNADGTGYTLPPQPYLAAE